MHLHGGEAMTIRAVFRVQCDGPCKGWLSWTEDYVPGTDMLPCHHVVAPTAERALNWPGERAARTAALDNGWVFSHDRSRPQPYKIYCPTCKVNPLGIVLPKACPGCSHVHEGSLCSNRSCMCGVYA